MKRGNTALKRGVGLASAFALAVAGAVIAAPAASAAPIASLSDAVRALPAKDAAQMTTPPVSGQAYSASKTGQVPNLIVGSNGAVSDFQILLPVGTGGGWSSGDTVSVVLGQSTGTGTANATKVTFNGVPNASVAATAVDAGSLANFVAGTATPGNAHLTDASIPSTPVVSSDGSTLTIPLPDPTGTGTAGANFVLTVTGVSVNVPSDVSIAAGQAVTATVQDGSGAAGTTTLGYIKTLELGANGAGTAKGNDVTLPPIVFKETTSTSLANFSVVVSGTNSGTALVLNTGGASVKTSNGATAALGTVTGTPATTLPVTATGTAATDSIAISGLTLQNVKPGSEITVTLVGTGIALNSDTNASASASTFSYTPNQAEAASVKFTPGAAANRIFGADRYETAAKIALDYAESAVGWTQSAVVIANGENATNGVDALSANFLAGVVNAPVLLTQADSLPKSATDALTKLFEDSTADIKVYVMGKTASVSQDVRDAVKKAISDTAFGSIATVTVVEVAGDNRYATSVEAVNTAKASNIGSYNLGKGFLRTAFLASGQNNADALAAGAVSFSANLPVLLTTDADELPKEVQDSITSDSIKQIVILGGTDRVSQGVEDSLKDAGVNVLRLAGSDRFDTAVKIANLGFKGQPDGVAKNNNGTVYLANGLGGFADALAAGPLAGTQGASLLTTSDATTLPASTQVFLATNKDDLDEVNALGGTDRVTAEVLTLAQALIK